MIHNDDEASKPMTLRERLADDPCQRCEGICTHNRRRLSLTRELNLNGCAHYYMKSAFPNLARFVRNLSLPKGELIAPNIPQNIASLAGTAFDHRLRMEHDPNYRDDVVQGGRHLMSLITPNVPLEDLQELDRGLRDPDPDIRSLNNAVCDTHFRSLRGLEAWNLIKDPESKEQILTDIRLLMEACQEKLHLESPIFGPTFYPGSAWIGGADADLISNKCLIDIKAGKKIAATEFVRQVLAYALLDVADEYQLDSVGIYLARYGQLWRIPLETIEEHTGSSITELRESAPWSEGMTTSEHAHMLANIRAGLGET